MEELDCGSVCRKTGVSPEGGDGCRDLSRPVLHRSDLYEGSGGQGLA